MTEHTSLLKPNCIEEVSFEKRDIEIFQIKDIKTKLDTIRNYFFPRFEIVLFKALDLVEDIYGINPYESMTIISNPNHRKDAKKNIDYHKAHIGISGKRDNNRELIIKHKDGTPYRYFPTDMVFELLPEEYCMRVILTSYAKGVDLEFSKKITDQLKTNSELLGSIFNVLHINYDVSQREEKLLSFEKFLCQSKENHMRFSSPGYFLPMEYNSGLWNLVLTFAGLYPLIDSFNLIAKGDTPRLKNMLEKFKTWWEAPLEELEEQDEEEQDTADKEPELPELDNYYLVRPGLRYEVLARDKWTCLSCGRSPKDGITLEVDHIKPRSLGGTNDLDNLQTLCWKCNIGKSNKDSTDLRA